MIIQSFLISTVLIVLAYGFGRLLVALIKRMNWRKSIRTYVLTFGWMTIALGGTLTLVSLHRWLAVDSRLIESAVHLGVSEGAVTILVGPITVLSVMVMIGAVLLAILPLRVELSGIDGTRTDLLLGWSIATILVVMAWSLFEVIVTGQTWIGPLGLSILGTVSLATLATIGGHRMHLLDPECRPPDDDEYARIEAAFEPLDITPDRVVIGERGDLDEAVTIRGRVGTRWLFIDKEFLTAASGTDLGVAVAQAVGVYRQYFEVQYWFVVTALATGLLIATSPFLGWWTQPWNFLAVFVLVPYVGIIWMSTRQIHRADDLAVELYGVETVRETYEQYGDDLVFILSDVPGYHLFSTDQPIERRIDRLESLTSESSK